MGEFQDDCGRRGVAWKGETLSVSESQLGKSAFIYVITAHRGIAKNSGTPDKMSPWGPSESPGVSMPLLHPSC